MKKELVFGLTAGAVFLWLPTLAFTDRQRKAILDRDDNQCQAITPHEHDTTHSLEVDHLIPQRYAERIGIPDVDLPEYALTKCRTAHDLRHPDRIQARETYRDNHNSFEEMGQERNGKLDHKEIYWNDEFDRQEMALALKRTEKAKQEGWVFPNHVRRKK